VIKFYVRREAVGELVKDARFIPRTQYIKAGETFDDEIGVWTEGIDIEGAIPILLLPEPKLSETTERVLTAMRGKK
jgi:hypothetical protein